MSTDEVFLGLSSGAVDYLFKLLDLHITNAKVNSLLESKDESVRLIAFRAIRRTDGKIDALPAAKKLAKDSSPAVRAEAALEMRYRKYDEAKDVLVDVAKGFDGTDRSYLDSLGNGAGHNASALWVTLADVLKPGNPTKWSDGFARLTWRLMSEAAVPALKERAASKDLSDAQRLLAVDSIAFIKSPASAEALMSIAIEDSPVKNSVQWWLGNRADGEWASMNLRDELEKRGISAKPAELVEVIVPLRPSSTKFSVEEVLALKGDAARGKTVAARCVMCHKIEGQGVDHGPDLKGFASRQPPEVVAKALVDPSAEIALGFEGTAINLKDGMWIDGLIVADGDPVVIRATGGIVQKVPKSQIASRKGMDRSLMLNADQLGLSAQDVADTIEWLKTYK